MAYKNVNEGSAEMAELAELAELEARLGPSRPKDWDTSHFRWDRNFGSWKGVRHEFPGEIVFDRGVTVMPGAGELPFKMVRSGFNNGWRFSVSEFCGWWDRGVRTLREFQKQYRLRTVRGRDRQASLRVYKEQRRVRVCNSAGESVCFCVGVASSKTPGYILVGSAMRKARSLGLQGGLGGFTVEWLEATA
ncbi:MAG TPA: hypothetical protein VEH04_17005 [Verrucomicrobiae bacterium]|nr:hypothetical protein [Verrucomicrobiae bacterium]